MVDKKELEVGDVVYAIYCTPLWASDDIVTDVRKGRVLHIEDTGIVTLHPLKIILKVDIVDGVRHEFDNRETEDSDDGWEDVVRPYPVSDVFLSLLDALRGMSQRLADDGKKIDALRIDAPIVL